MYVRPASSLKREIKEIVIADIVLTIAFSFTLLGGIENLTGYSALMNLLLFIPISAVGVTLSFVLHELMHKFVAQRYGAIAGFQSSRSGLLITIATGLFGFLLGIPGATMIYADRFTKRQNGIVSLAGPATNFVVFLAFLAIRVFGNPTGYLLELVSIVMFISILLAFFNMLPIMPLDGSKVLAWNPYVYFATMGVIFILTLLFTAISLTEIILMFIIALIFSMFYRTML
ncbi:MAG: site-2 protease family protein [Candidatus Marsarchaeota archaeon]|jgi:Zn-dependent protease|nr:site-2 protease family protein [Candidatus Marsarchaeota archaeon]